MNDIKKLMADFLKQQEYSARRSKETIRGYKAAFDLLLKFRPQLEVDDLTTETLTDFFEFLQTRKRLVGSNQEVIGVKTSTTGTYRSKFNAFFNWLIETERLKNNPFKGIDYPIINYDDRKYLSKQDVERIFTSLNMHASNPLIRKRNIALFSVLLYCGLRKNELISLKILDINFDSKELKVRAETSKSKRNRIIPLHREALYAIKDYIEARNSKKYKTEYLFVSNTGDRPLTTHGLKHLVETIKEKSGVNFHLHRFRHTFAVNLLSSGCDGLKLRQLLGHKSLRMTLAYTRALPSTAMADDINKISINKLL